MRTREILLKNSLITFGYVVEHSFILYEGGISIVFIIGILGKEGNSVRGTCYTVRFEGSRCYRSTYHIGSRGKTDR